MNSTYLKHYVQIPVPPINVQKEIIQDCEKIDLEYHSSRMEINEYKEKIEEIFVGGGAIIK